MDSIKIWLKLMFILSLIVAAFIIGIIIVPVLVFVALIYLAYYIPKLNKEIKESESSVTKPSDYFKKHL